MGEVLSMGFLDKFEKGVENVTNRAMSRFSDDIEPIEIASKLRETMDKRAASFARDRSVVPNIFRIHLPQCGVAAPGMEPGGGTVPPRYGPARTRTCVQADTVPIVTVSKTLQGRRPCLCEVIVS